MAGGSTQLLFSVCLYYTHELHKLCGFGRKFLLLDLEGKGSVNFEEIWQVERPYIGSCSGYCMRCNTFDFMRQCRVRDHKQRVSAALL